MKWTLNSVLHYNFMVIHWHWRCVKAKLLVLANDLQEKIKSFLCLFFPQLKSADGNKISADSAKDLGKLIAFVSLKDTKDIDFGLDNDSVSLDIEPRKDQVGHHLILALFTLCRLGILSISQVNTMYYFIQSVF